MAKLTTIKTRYTIFLFRGMSQYTLYDGHSYDAASKAVDIARSILIFSNGTAQIAAQYDGKGYHYPVWDVVDGQAEAKMPIREPLLLPLEDK